MIREPPGSHDLDAEPARLTGHAVTWGCSYSDCHVCGLAGSRASSGREPGRPFTGPAVLRSAAAGTGERRPSVTVITSATIIISVAGSSRFPKVTKLLSSLAVTNLHLASSRKWDFSRKLVLMILTLANYSLRFGLGGAVHWGVSGAGRGAAERLHRDQY